MTKKARGFKYFLEVSTRQTKIGEDAELMQHIFYMCASKPR